MEPSSIMFSWTGPGGVVTGNDRILNPTTSINNTHTNSLQFMYLMEGDNGTYRCDVAILETTGAVSVELGPLVGKFVYTYTTVIQM